MYSNTKRWVKENKELVFLFVAIVIAFLVYSYFYLSLPLKFNSPDENSNYFFIKNYVENGVLRVFEPLNFVALDRIHPRSVVVVNGYLVPGGFLGIILIYGWLAKIFGLKVVFILTPLFACLAVFCFYKIIQRVFNNQIAFWSSLLLLIHPAFWYFSSRGLFPNVLFISFLIFGFYFLQQGAVRNARTYVEYILAGLFFGLAMTVRLSEFFWVSVLLLFLFLFYRKKVNWKQVILFLFFAFITFSPIFAYNYIFYGNPLLTAYNLSDSNITDNSNSPYRLFTLITHYIFPFGLNFKNILKNFSNYFAGMFWWLAIPFAIGLSVFIKKFIDGKLAKEQKVFLFFCSFVFLFLFAYYGSWLFYDTPTKEISIGTAYNRYWLPIYILSLPLIVFILIKFVDWFSGRQKKVMAVVLSLIIFLLSFKLTFFDKNDGLFQVMRNVKKYAVVAHEVNQIIEREAVIIVDQADKIFFPEYKVIHPLRNEGTYKLIPKLTKLVPLYYYGITLPQRDIDYLYAKKLNPEEVKIIKIKDFGMETLYKLEPK